LIPTIVRALLAPDMLPASSERDRLIALVTALEVPPRAVELPDDDATVAVARHHRLTPLLSAVCGPRLSAKIGAIFRRDRLITAARNMLLGGVAEEVIRALAADGVRTIVLKGLDYEARLYRLTGARPTSDVDLLVPDERRRDAFTVLDRLGFEPRAAAPGFDEPDYHEVAWTRKGVEVDLHLALAPLARCRIDYAAVWGEAEDFDLGQTKALDLSRCHGAVFHALHMAIDHFDVPAIYLVDLTRLLPAADDLLAARETARRWRCARPLETAAALAAEFLPHWAAGMPPIAATAAARTVIAGYGTTGRLRRAEQLRRKLQHFDAWSDMVRYTAIQSRRVAKHWIERRVLRRTARQRLGL
jgi:hypothetical protein